MSFLDSLAAAFKGARPADRPPLARSYASPWLFPEAYGLASPRGTFNYDAAVRTGYLHNPVAQRAVRLVAEGVGGAPLSASDPALLTLVSATSAGQSLAETIAAQLLLHGNGYIQVLKDTRGRPVELFRRPAAGQLSGNRTTGYDVSPDGQRFFIIEQQQLDRRATAALIFNWRGDLERALRR